MLFKGFDGFMSSNDVVIDSATVVLLSEFKSDKGSKELKVMLAKRSADLSFLPNHWVFPGGAVDDADYVPAGNHQNALQKAAVREVMEEVAVDISANELHHFAHWITPEAAPRRYSTYFFWTFLSEAQRQLAQVDGSELVELAWLSAEQAIDMQANGQMPMLPPTLVSLLHLQGCKEERQVEVNLSSDKLESITPKMAIDDENLLMLYPGDNAYESGDIGFVNADEPQHRCVMQNNIWRFVDTR